LGGVEVGQQTTRRPQRQGQLAEAQARQREAQQQLGRIQTLKNRGFASRTAR
jgi:hypothetical protein